MCTRAHWLCWILAGNKIAVNFQVQSNGDFFRSMLNSSVVGGNSPAIDSPSL